MAENRCVGVEPSRLGSYALLESCGEGPRGQVFKAESEGRFYALKIYHAKTWTRWEDLEKLSRGGSLIHPNILPVEDIGSCDDWRYSASRFLPGDSLRELLSGLREGSLTSASLCPIGATAAGGPQPDHLYRCVRMIEKVARGLQAAHEAGVVHGRISSGNLMFSPSGMLLLVDFGGGGHSLAGELHYRAPEELQQDSWPAHKGSDIYALGAVLYEMLTLNAPYALAGDESSGPAAIREAILAGPPPAPSSLSDEMPPSLEACVTKAMARDPEDRYPSAAKLAEDLARFLAGENTHAALEKKTLAVAAVAPAFRLSHRLIAATVLLMMIAGAAWYSSQADTQSSLLNGALDALSKGDHAAARSEAGRLKSLNPGNARAKALSENIARARAADHLVRAMEAWLDGDREAARNAVGAASDLLPQDTSLAKIAERLKEAGKE